MLCQGMDIPQFVYLARYLHFVFVVFRFVLAVPLHQVDIAKYKWQLDLKPASPGHIYKVQILLAS